MNTEESQEQRVLVIEVPNVVEATGTLLALDDYWSEDYEQTVANVAGQIAEGSARVYTSEARLFALWLQEHGFQEMSREAIIAYHKHLRDYKPNTAARKWSVVKQIVAEYIIRHELPTDPARNIKGFQTEESSRHIALSDEEARRLLLQPDRTRKLGMRDYAMIRLLLRLALRRSECVKLLLSDMGMRQGHHTLLIRQSKRNKTRLLKLPVDVWRTMMDYQEMIGNVMIPREGDATRLYERAEWQVGESHPLFVGFDKGDRPTHQGMSGDTVYRTVRYYGRLAKIEKLTSHSMRATGITLMLEKDEPLWRVQDLAGHADPRQTRAYQKRREHLDRSAADALDL